MITWAVIGSAVIALVLVVLPSAIKLVAFGEGAFV
jgi:hypothetical protein